MTNFLLSHVASVSNSNINRSNGKFIDTILLFFVFAVTFFVTRLFAPLSFDSHHQGLMLQGAMSFVDGETLYKDVYYHYGPLTAIIHHFSMVAMGASLYSLQAVTVLFYSLSSVLLYLIWIRFLPRILALFTYVCWLGLSPYWVWEMFPWSSDIALFFLLLSSYSVIISIERNQPAYLLLTGLAVSLTFWSRQTVGIVLFFSVFVVLCSFVCLQGKIALKGLMYYAVGFASVSAIFAVWLVAADAGSSYVKMCIVNAADAVGGLDNSSPYSFIEQILTSLFPISRGSVMGETRYHLWGLYPIVLVLLFLEILIYFFREGRIARQTDPSRSQNIINMPRTRMLFSVVVISLASWSQYYPVNCIRHVFWAASPFLGIVVYYMWRTTVHVFHSCLIKNRVFRALLRGSCLAVLFCVAIVLFQNICHRVIVGMDRYSTYNVTIAVPTILSGMKTSLSNWRSLKSVSEAIGEVARRNPNCKIAIRSLSKGLDGNWSMYLYPFFALGESRGTNRQHDKSIVLLHSSKKKKIRDYRLLVHVTFSPALAYDVGSYFIYNHENTKTNFYLYRPDGI